MKFSGVGRKSEPFNWTEALTRVSLIRKGMISRLVCAYPVQIRKLWMNRYLPFMRLTNAANISKLSPVPLNTNWYFKIFALPSLYRVGMKWTWSDQRCKVINIVWLNNFIVEFLFLSSRHFFVKKKKKKILPILPNFEIISKSYQSNIETNISRTPPPPYFSRPSPTQKPRSFIKRAIDMHGHIRIFQ